MTPPRQDSIDEIVKRHIELSNGSEWEKKWLISHLTNWFTSWVEENAREIEACDENCMSKDFHAGREHAAQLLRESLKQ